MKHVISCTKLVNFSGKKKHKNQQQKKKNTKTNNNCGSYYKLTLLHNCHTDFFSINYINV